MSGYTLQDVLNPISIFEFVDTYWSKSHLHLQGNTSEKFTSLLTLEDFDEIITLRSHDSIRVIKERIPVSPALYGYGHDKEAMIKYFNEGFSIVYEKLNNAWEPLRKLCWNITNELGIVKSAYANVYFTPVSSKALARHVDWQDVFVIQVYGEKRWSLFESEFKYPINTDQSQRIAPALESAPKIDEVNLKAGELLYVPRGMAHEVSTQGQESLHITLTVEALTNFDILTHIFNQMVDNNQFLRENISPNFFKNPKGYQTELLAQLGEHLEENGALYVLEKALHSHTNSNLSGYFLDQRKVSTIDGNTILKRREQFEVDFERIGNAFEISTRHSKVRIIDIVEEINFIRQSNVFRIDDIPGMLELEEKLDLVNYFIKIGFLQIE